MNNRNKFEEIKIQMVMKLKKLSHHAAVEEIARMDAAKRKAAEEEAARQAALEEKRAALRSQRGESADINRSDEEDFMSAEEFFFDAD